MSTVIYLDHAATTPIHPDVLQAMMPYLTEQFGNPSSMHCKGLEAEQAIEAVRRKLGRLTRTEPSEWIFTSGATESNAIAILGAARASRRRHVVVSAVEHPSVLENVKLLQGEGFAVDQVPVDSGGVIRLERAAELIREDTALVSVMHGNNELGSIQPIAQLGRLVQQQAPKCLLHVDAAQSFCRIPTPIGQWNADLVSLSAHKIHGPKGGGALYARRGVRLRPLFSGGGQEAGLRSGTQNVAAIVGLGSACELAPGWEAVAELRLRLERLLESSGRVSVLAESVERLPHIVCLDLGRNVKAEVVLHALEQKGIAVSAGSACATRNRKQSHVLAAIGLPEDHGAIRVSLGLDTTWDQLEVFAQSLEGVFRDIGRYFTAP